MKSTKLAVIVITAISFPFQTAHTTRNVVIIAHRGASYDAPENTAISAKLAWDQNADAVETDIRLTKDGKVIVSHDDNVKRLTGVDASVSELTLAEAQTLDAGRYKGKQFTGEKMPTIGDLIATAPINGRIFIHIKTGAEILPALDETLKHLTIRRGNIVLICFDLDVLRQAHQRWPQYTTLWLVGYRSSIESIDQLIKESKDAGISGLNLSWQWPVDAAAVDRIRAAHLQLYVWTVDDPEIAKDWIDIGVDGITTNRAGWIREKIEI